LGLSTFGRQMAKARTSLSFAETPQAAQFYQFPRETAIEGASLADGAAMDRLDAMQVLLAVVDEGSLSAGSRRLRAPLPSVSRKVAELERHLGTRLLIRTSRNVQLTDAGRDYVDAVRQIVGEIKAAELRASGEYEVPRGELRITATLEFGRMLVLPLAYEFLLEHPEIKLDVVSANRFLDLIENHIDVGIRLGPLADSSLVAVKVGEIRSVTCASPEYLEKRGTPVTPNDLAGHDAVQFGTLVLGWSEPENDTMQEVVLNVRVHTSDVSAACKAVVQGLGIARMPSFMVTDDLRSGALIEILKEYAPKPYPVHIVYVKQGLLPLKTRAFIDWMTPRLRQALKDCEAAKP
jgi:DNA-binding transcriptional LysR family regulator